MAARHLTFHYTLRNREGSVLDTSQGAEPLSCVEGAGQIIEGLEMVLRGMKAGEKRLVVVPREGLRAARRGDGAEGAARSFARG